MTDTSVIGKSVERKEGREKVTGSARYVDDLVFPEMIFGATVRGPIARGRIRVIRFADNIPCDEFTIVRAADIPGKNCIARLIDDQPCFAADLVNHPEEPILLLAHPDKYLLEKARQAVQIDIDPRLPFSQSKTRLPKKKSSGSRQYLQILSDRKRKRG